MVDRLAQLRVGVARGDFGAALERGFDELLDV
jgi:hypothetical protein